MKKPLCAGTFLKAFLPKVYWMGESVAGLSLQAKVNWMESALKSEALKMRYEEISWL